MSAAIIAWLDKLRVKVGADGTDTDRRGCRQADCRRVSVISFASNNPLIRLDQESPSKVLIYAHPHTPYERR